MKISIIFMQAADNLRRNKGQPILMPVLKQFILQTDLVFKFKYSETCLKRPLKNRQNKGLKDRC